MIGIETVHHSLCLFGVMSLLKFLQHLFDARVFLAWKLVLTKVVHNDSSHLLDSIGIFLSL